MEHPGNTEFARALPVAATLGTGDYVRLLHPLEAFGKPSIARKDVKGDLHSRTYECKAAPAWAEYGLEGDVYVSLHRLHGPRGIERLAVACCRPEAGVSAPGPAPARRLDLEFGGGTRTCRPLVPFRQRQSGYSYVQGVGQASGMSGKLLLADELADGAPDFLRQLPEHVVAIAFEGHVFGLGQDLPDVLLAGGAEEAVLIAP